MHSVNNHCLSGSFCCTVWQPLLYFLSQDAWLQPRHACNGCAVHCRPATQCMCKPWMQCCSNQLEWIFNRNATKMSCAYEEISSSAAKHFLKSLSDWNILIAVVCSCACINVLSMAKQGSMMMLIQGLNMFNYLACFNINKPVAKLKCESEVKKCLWNFEKIINTK